ncbi:MAG: chemotaxis protein CheC [Candidatus Thermoplasmatota archaeon]|nr:chemotaxis protein CheC [Candidatus Thermoplasmatota archaeon]
MKMNLSEMQMDALREVGNIGASHAADSLSTMIDGRVDITVPNIQIQKIGNLEETLSEKNPGKRFLFTMEGEARSAIVLNFTQESASILGSYLTLGDPNPPEDIDEETKEMMASAIQEVANILVSSTADAFAALLDIRMDISVPISMDSLREGIEKEGLGADLNPDVIVFDTMLKSEILAVSTNMYFLPFKRTMEPLLEKLGVANL